MKSISEGCVFDVSTVLPTPIDHTHTTMYAAKLVEKSYLMYGELFSNPASRERRLVALVSTLLSWSTLGFSIHLKPENVFMLCYLCSHYYTFDYAVVGILKLLLASSFWVPAFSVKSGRDMATTVFGLATFLTTKHIMGVPWAKNLIALWRVLLKYPYLKKKFVHRCRSDSKFRDSVGAMFSGHPQGQYGLEDPGSDGAGPDDVGYLEEKGTNTPTNADIQFTKEDYYDDIHQMKRECSAFYGLVLKDLLKEDDKPLDINTLCSIFNQTYIPSKQCVIVLNSNGLSSSFGQEGKDATSTSSGKKRRTESVSTASQEKTGVTNGSTGKKRHVEADTGSAEHKRRRLGDNAMKTFVLSKKRQTEGRDGPKPKRTCAERKVV
jgi:hypothetical protein